MHEDEEDPGPSKSAVKREMTARQDLGEALVQLSVRELARMPVDNPELFDAIEQARTIRSNSARRRQMQYIGKLMRNIDPQPIATALEALYQQHQGEVDHFHHLEALRDQLLSEGVAGIGTLLEHYPQADRQHARALLLQHQREVKSGKAPAAARKLFRYLRELSEC